VPLGASVPLQPPEAVQDSALVELHVSDEVPPRATAAGEAVRIAVGRGFTVTAALDGALIPPGPEQVRMKVALAFKAPLLWLPLAGNTPLQLPDALQDEALLEVQVNVEDPPASIVVGEAVSDALGTGGGGLLPPPHADNTIGPIIRRQRRRRTSSQRCFFDFKPFQMAQTCADSQCGIDMRYGAQERTRTSTNFSTGT
jgi:hypothetical protein